MKSKYNVFNKTFTFISLISILSVLGLGFVSQRYVNGIPLFVGVDLEIFNVLMHHPVLEQIAGIITSLFSFQTIGIMGILLIFFLYRKKMLFYLSVFFFEYYLWNFRISYYEGLNRKKFSEF